MIALGHAARTGKDALAEILVRDHGFTRIAFADALRSVVYDSNPKVRELVDRMGWDGAKVVHPSVRQALIDVGNACRRHIAQDIWIRAVAEQVAPDSRIVVPDLRYPNEFEWASAVGCTVKVIRPGVDPLPNVADQALVGETRWTHTIHNDGSLEDLAVAAKKLVSTLSLEQ